jgi:hypothetical protein
MTPLIAAGSLLLLRRSAPPETLDLVNGRNASSLCRSKHLTAMIDDHTYTQSEDSGALPRAQIHPQSPSLRALPVAGWGVPTKWRGLEVSVSTCARYRLAASGQDKVSTYGELNQSVVFCGMRPIIVRCHFEREIHL